MLFYRRQVLPFGHHQQRTGEENVAEEKFRIGF